MTTSKRKRTQKEETGAKGAAPTPGSKRRRVRRPAAPALETLAAREDAVMGRPATAGSATVLVCGLPPGCTVLELKSRMQMYGAVSRTRVEGGDGGLGYVTFRSPDSAQAAVLASADPVFGVAIGSSRVVEPPSKRLENGCGKVRISQIGDPFPLGYGPGATSKLLRAELPLRKHGRGNKKLNEGMMPCYRSTPDMPYNGRQLVAYDDLL